jgi:predicted permease
MKHLRAALARLRGLFARPQMDDELREELEAHLEMETAEYVRRGMSYEAARRKALLASGGMVQAAEAVRDQRGLPWVEGIAADVRYALRALRRAPAFAAVVVVTLALGIGANTAIFSVVNAVILKPLPYPDAARLVFITSQFPGLGFDQFWVSVPEFVEFREHNHSFQDVGAYRAGAVNLGTEDQPRRVNSAVVTSELMPVLGVPMLRGRQFSRADTLPGAEDVGILSSEVWRSAFGGDESVVGRVLPIDGEPTRIIGILPPGYDVHEQKVQVWLPLTLDPAKPGNRGGHNLYLVGRLKDGVSLSQAKADVETLLQQWGAIAGATHVPDPQRHRIRLDALQDDVVGRVRTSLWVLQGAVGFVLLIACANLANLLLARAESRAAGGCCASS